MALSDESDIHAQVLCRMTTSCHLTLMARLPHAPFPYDGLVGDTDQPFFDRTDPDNGQRLHTVNDTIFYPEFPYYQDNRVLVHLPPAFKPDAPFAILVFFHGHLTELDRTLVREMALLQQVNATDHNLVLVAPQMVRDAIDSSPGKLYRPQGLANLLGDVSRVLAEEMDEEFAGQFARAPVILAAFSGGYRALAYTLERGFADTLERDARLRGVILLDALYSDADKFIAWLRHPERRGFLVNLYGPSSAPLSEKLSQNLQEYGLSWSNSLSPPLSPDRAESPGPSHAPDWSDSSDSFHVPNWSDPPEVTIDPTGIYSLMVETPHESIFLEGPPPWPLVKILKMVKFL
ncbi:MAG: hypothetical protein HQL65_19775 [Magnetococcales bacterium]|nr:hypothetical protein [Magnetococcales bacterium]